jgi:predicted dithiol-disulfide oxidoreductase (DUF899 family)
MEQPTAEFLAGIETLAQEIADKQQKLQELKKQAGLADANGESGSDESGYMTVAKLFQEIIAKQEQLRTLQKKQARRDVPDYELTDRDGNKVKLSTLFGDKRDLIVIHNMGASCSYCTLWADGFNGVLQHLEDRAAFIVVSPDDPESQRKFAESRNWAFDMYSGKDSAFTEEMGYSYTKHGVTYQLPGLSTFYKTDDGNIVRTGADGFGPGDVYSSIWHMFALLEKGVDGWEPKYHYC